MQLVKFEEDETNKRVVSGWPAAFDNSYALGMGFVVDQGGIREIVKKFKEDVNASIG